jgi:hypothetical protein
MPYAQGSVCLSDQVNAINLGSVHWCMILRLFEKSDVTRGVPREKPANDLHPLAREALGRLS